MIKVNDKIKLPDMLENIRFFRVTTRTLGDSFFFFSPRFLSPSSCLFLTNDERGGSGEEEEKRNAPRNPPTSAKVNDTRRGTDVHHPPPARA